ncbi:unnamed protein product, partial [Vitis vinifera]
MKRSVRPLFSILLLIAAAGTLTFRVALRRGFASFHLETDDLAGPRRVVPVFNSTLLRIAAVDLSEAQSKHEIEQMLEGNFAGQGRYRTFASWRRFNHIDDHARSSRGVPIQLRSPKFYRYWLEFRRNLNDWYRNKRFHPEIMSDLIRLVKHPIDEHNGLVGLGKRYSSCAVVGNSGILLRSDYGEMIDSHEAVIRLNNARLDRFEHNVGSKTSISFINSNILHLCARREGCFCHPYGVNAVMLALGICDKVSIFGFGKSASAKHHYHTTQKAELPLHDYEAEYDFYHDLVERPQVIPFISSKFNIPPGSSYCLLTLLSWPATRWRVLDTRETVRLILE